jgi:hypothetical protein
MASSLRLRPTFPLILSLPPLEAWKKNRHPLLCQGPKNIADRDAASKKLLIGFRRQPAALGALEFNGIEAEVFVDDAALYGSHSFRPNVQREFSRNVYGEEIGEHRLGGGQQGVIPCGPAVDLGVSGPWVGNDVHFGSFLLFGKFSCRALGDLFKVPPEVNV